MMDTEILVIAGSRVRFHQDEVGHNDVGALNHWQNDQDGYLLSSRAHRYRYMKVWRLLALDAENRKPLHQALNCELDSR